MLVVLFNGILNTTVRRDPPKMGRPSASVSSPAKPTLTFANKRSGGDASTKGGHSFVGGKEDVKEAAAVFGGGGPITVAVLLLLNGDLESPTLPREMRLQDLPSSEEENLGTRREEDGDRDEDHRDKDKEEKRKRASLSLEERLRDVPEEKTIVIGRNNTNTYVLDVPDLPYLLSRTHAKCVSAGDEHFIYDFKTTNGTYINGKIIEKQKFVKLMHGDIVSFGGPANVLRNEKSMKNPFRFRYLRTKVARDFETGSRAFQQQTQRELLRQNTNNNASEVSGAAVRKRDHGVAGNANAAAARAGGNVGPSGAKKLKMSTFPLVGKGVDAQPLTLGGGYDDEFVPIFSQGPSQEIDDYGTIVHSQNIDGSVDHEKIRETFEEGLLKLFEGRGGEFAQKFNSAFMNIPIEKEKNKVVAKDVDKGAVVVDDDAGTSGEKKVGDDAKMESADESPEDDSQTKNKKKKRAKTAVTANDDDDFTHQVGSDNISDGSNEEHEMETADHKKRNDLDVQLMAKLSRACANRIVPFEDAQHEMPPWIEHELRCPICREFLVRPHCIQGCGHVFCFGCIYPWLAKSKPCPLCRHKPAVCLPPKIDSMEAARSFEMIGPKSYKVKNQLTPCHVHDKLLKMYVLKWLTPAQKLKRLNFEEEGKRVERLLEKGELKRIKEEFEAGIPPNALEVPGGGVGANDAMNELGLRAAFLRAYHMERAAQHLNLERRNSAAAAARENDAANNNTVSQERSAVRMQFEAARLPPEEDIQRDDSNRSQEEEQEQEEREEEEVEDAMLQRAQETATAAREAARKKTNEE